MTNTVEAPTTHMIMRVSLAPLRVSKNVKYMGRKRDVYDFMLFSEKFLFLAGKFLNVWIGEKHKIIDVPFPPNKCVYACV